MGYFRLIIDSVELRNSIRDMADRGERRWNTFKQEVIREGNFVSCPSGSGEVMNPIFEKKEFQKLIGDVYSGTYGLKTEVNKIIEMIDAYRSFIQEDDYLPSPPGFKSIVLNGIISDKEKANFIIELNELLNSFGLKVEFAKLEKILSKAICETGEENYNLSSFDYIYSEFRDDFVKYSQSFQFFLEGENREFKILSPHIKEFLKNNRSKEAIICDNYLFKWDGYSMVETIVKIWLFVVETMKNHDLETLIFIYNNYKIKDENKIEEKIRSYVGDHDLDDKLGEVEFYFVNLNEEGKNRDSKKDKKPKGIFHKREILTSKYRISFDTKVKFDDWNNFIELHPYYYGHVATYLTKSNQFRGFHLYRNLYYLKEVVEKSKNFKNFETAKNNLWRTEFFRRFEEVTKDKDLSVYFSELDFFNVKLEYCKF